ncbi:MAG: DUF4037 domain-containing protein [Lachnospiraceae bacterium]|nr:DUF4037 domain-containing protein [Lachnospiraceae bacterium]
MEASRRFYEKEVKRLIKEQFGAYEDRIAVGIAGEGSDCFGYDDLMSRDHDFGTGVCLWVTSEDMNRFGRQLSIAYHELIDRMPGNNLSERLLARRGVMTVNDFYSNILGIRCEAEQGTLSEAQWLSLDHSCLATAVNGEVFRDDLGLFTAFRNYLLDYYPERVFRIRMAEKLHQYAAAMQVNYARCMTRRDLVAARQCQAQGVEAAMELFFLLARKYPPYYKWTYRRLCELDEGGQFARLVKALSEARCDEALWKDAWESVPYRPNVLNLKDPAVGIAEQLAGLVVTWMRREGLTQGADPYLERYVDELGV